MTLMVVALTAVGQNNPYRINDKIYPIYQKALEKRTTPEGLELARQMHEMAKSLGDKKAECVALTIPTLYYYFNDENGNLFDAAVDKLMKAAEANGMPDYYYLGVSNKSRWYVNRDKTYMALVYTRKMNNQAIEKKHNYGIYATTKDLAMIYEARSETRSALAEYEKALSFARKNMPSEDTVTVYLQMAYCYCNMRQFDKQLDCADIGLKAYKGKDRKNMTQGALRTYDMLLQVKANALFELGRRVEFIAMMQDIGNPPAEMSLPPKARNTMACDIYRELKLMELIAQDKWDEAKNFVDNEECNNIEKLRLRIIYSENKGDFKDAHSMLMQRNFLLDSISQLTLTNDMNEITEQLDSGLIKMQWQRLRLKRDSLNLSNMRLNMTKNELELSRVRSNQESDNLRAENYMLSSNNKRLENVQLEDSLKRQEVEQRERDAKMKANRTIFSVIAAVLLLILIITVLYLRNREKLSRQLKIANKKLNINVVKLKDARDEADKANRMKTMFIQNMSHEIRTPLNAIVGFSQLIAKGGDGLGQQERKDMSSRIAESSDLLITIINDILDLSTLESGKYLMDKNPTRINDVCRMSMDTVLHRKAEGVELKFESDVPDEYTINTDENRVKQVLINFLTNAAKNTTKGEITVSVWTEKKPGYVQLAVTDTGIGVPEDKQDVIFERFKKLDVFKQGTGLGLNICMAIAERLGGSISLDKSYKNGARFIFELKLD